MRRGFSRADVAAALVVLTVVGAVGVTVSSADPSGRTERLMESLANLRAIGAATSHYRADNAGYLPLEMTTVRRRPRADGRDIAGWCTWNYGGKNCSAFWVSGAAFDVEAADRPLNPYLYPDYTFTAPPPPARLPANDPARLNQQARVFRDPADINGHQRRWPQANSPQTSCYDDIGTSYPAQMAWWNQIVSRFPAMPFAQQYNLGTSRLATDQGVDPSRFIYFHDETGDLVLNSSSPQFISEGNHGVRNAGVALFADGHAGLTTFRAGMSRNSSITAEYSVWFEDLGRPGGDPRPTPVPGR